MSWFISQKGLKKIRVAAVTAKAGFWLSLDGRSAFVADEKKSVRAGAKDDAVRAPMTAKVVQLKTRAGAVVAAEELLLVLEAMKMEYRLSSPRAATVASVLCREGDLVDLGQILIKLE